MSRLPSFWKSVWTHRGSILKSWDLWASLACGIAFALGASDKQIAGTTDPLATAELGVAAALLGVVLAGLAVIVVFLDEEYVALLSRVDTGVEADFFPFWFTAGLAVATVVMSCAIMITHARLLPWSLRAMGAIGFWWFLWTLFSTLNLVAFVGAHGSNRALQILQRRRGSRTLGAPRGSSPSSPDSGVRGEETHSETMTLLAEKDEAR